MVICAQCGREGGHFIGCAKAAPPPPPSPAASADHCAKDGCTEPRAASKGPRPAKYCEEHKTGSKK